MWAYYLEGFIFSFMSDLILPFEERCGYHLQVNLTYRFKYLADQGP